MKEIIIIETQHGEKLKRILQQEHYPYKVYQEQNIFANYDKAIKDKEREKEVKLWDEVDLDEELNKDDEEYWRQAVRAASKDEQRNKEIAAWDKIASKVKGR